MPALQVRHSLVMPVQGDCFKIVLEEGDLYAGTLSAIAKLNKIFSFRVQNGDHLTVDDIGTWIFTFEHTVYVDEPQRKLAFVATWNNPSLSLPLERRRVRIDIDSTGTSEIVFI